MSKIISVDKNLTRGVLDNGFTYYLRSDHDSNAPLSFYFLVKAGEEQEDGKQTEAAHLIEHMALNSTKFFPDVRFFLDGHGLVFGPDYNGSTGAKVTKYRISVAQNNSDIRINCLRLIRDWANGDINFDSARVAGEKGAVLQEIARTSGEFTRTYGEFLANIIGGVNHNGRILVDSRVGLSGLKHDDLVRFYKQWYIPSREALVVTGRFDSDSLESEIKRLFGSLEVRNVDVEANDRYFSPVKFRGKGGMHFIRKNEGDDIECKIVFKSEFVPVITCGDLKANIVRKVLVSLIEGRFKAARRMEDSQQFSVVYNEETSEFGRPFSSIIFSFKCVPNEMSSCYIGVISEITRIKKFGFCEAEIESVKGNLKRELDKLYGQNMKPTVNDYVANFVWSAPIFDYEHIHLVANNILNGIGSRDVMNALVDFDPSRNGNLVFFIPQKYLNAVDAQKIREWNSQAKKISIEKFNVVFSKEIVDSARQPVPSLISDELAALLGGELVKLVVDSIPTIDAVSVKLSNGIRVILKSTGFENGGVFVNAAKRGNLFAGDKIDSIITMYSPYLVVNSGVGRQSSTDWQRYQEERQVKVAAYARPDGAIISGHSKKSNVNDLLQVFRLLITEPKVDENLFYEWKDEQIDEIARRRDLVDVNDIYIDALSAELDFAKRIINDKNDFLHVGLDSVLEKYNEMYSNDGRYHFFVCGNFVLDSMLLLLNKYIGTIPVVSMQGDIWSDRPQAGPRARKVKIFEGKGPSTSRVDILFPSIAPLDPCSDVLMKVLKEEFGRMLLARLRSKEGISYSPRVNISKAWIPDNTDILTVYFDCANGRTFDAVRYVEEELMRLQDISVQNLLLESSRNAVKVALKVRNRDSFFWSGYLLEGFLNGLKVSGLSDCSGEIDEMTANSVSKAAKALSNGNSLIYILQAVDNSAN